MKDYKIILSSIVAGLLISGCSVAPKPILQDFIKEDVKNNLEYLDKIGK